MSKIVGVLGGGQLARMMIPPAIEMGIELRVLADVVGSSAAIAATAVADHRDLDAVLAFAEGVDVITFDHEHVPQEILAALVERGVSVRPAPEALVFAQDKLAMRDRLDQLGVPMPDWVAAQTAEALDAFIAAHGGRAVVKLPRGGYDGKGVRVVSASSDVTDWFELADALLVEELVPFQRELSQVVARRESGEIALWPVVESIQRDGVCVEVIAPARGRSPRLAELAGELATIIATELGVTGVLAVELFQTEDERVLVNELAMRPHNSGHWTIDGSQTSQFEQHLRAVLDLPLGPTGTRDAWSAMVNVLGGRADDRYSVAMADQPGVKYHFYGKESRPGRKVGHVTAGGDELTDVLFRARAAAAFFEA